MIKLIRNRCVAQCDSHLRIRKRFMFESLIVKTFGAKRISNVTIVSYINHSVAYNGVHLYDDH